MPFFISSLFSLMVASCGRIMLQRGIAFLHRTHKARLRQHFLD